MRLLFVFSLFQAALSSAISKSGLWDYEYTDEDDFGLWEVKFEHSSEDKGYYWESIHAVYYNAIEEHWERPVDCHYYCTPEEPCSGRQWCTDKTFEYFWDGQNISVAQAVNWGQDRACIASTTTMELQRLDDTTGIFTGTANITVQEVNIL